jgi:hypothetical protein
LGSAPELGRELSIGAVPDWTILSRMRRGLRSPVLVTLMLFGAGCGRAAEPASSPALDSAPPAPAAAPGETGSLTDLDALEHDLTVSEERLNQYLERREQSRETAIALSDQEARGESKKAEKPKSSAASGGGEYAQPPPAAAPRPARKRADDRPADAAEAAPAAPTTAPVPESEPVGSACDLACRAFGSMQRSADRICSIAGEGDQRCRRARERVADANARISSAQCVCQTDE